MAPAGFEAANLTSEGDQTHALDRAVTGAGILLIFLRNFTDNILRNVRKEGVARQQPDVPAYSSCDIQLQNVAPDDGLKSPKHVEHLMINKDTL